MNNQLRAVHDFMDKHEWVTTKRNETREVRRYHGLASSYAEAVPGFTEITEECRCCCGLRIERRMMRHNVWDITKIYE